MTKTTFATVETNHDAMNTWRDRRYRQDPRPHGDRDRDDPDGQAPSNYAAHLVGEGVIVTNADKIKLTGNKAKTRVTPLHGHPGGLREKVLDEYMESAPEEVVRLAVRRMLPKNRIAPHDLAPQGLPR